MSTVSSATTTGSASAAAVKAITNTSPNIRFGKIARLPSHIQEDLNQRLQNHQPGRVILPWLNGLSEVQAILRESFNDKPINEQNLSNWRRGGFHEWQCRQKWFACFRNVAQDAADIESTVGNLTEHAARLLALQFSLALCPPAGIRGHSGVPDYPPAIINNFCKIARAISSLRHGDHTAARLKLQEQKQAHPQKSTPPQPPLKVNQAKSSLSPLSVKPLCPSVPSVVKIGPSSTAPSPSSVVPLRTYVKQPLSAGSLPAQPLLKDTASPPV